MRWKKPSEYHSLSRAENLGKANPIMQDPTNEKNRAANPTTHKVAILGAGMMGSAMTLPLAARGHDIALCGSPLDEGIISRLFREGVHDKLDLELPTAALYFRHDEIQNACRDADLILFGVSSPGIEWATARLNELLEAKRVREDVLVCMITKGLALSEDRLITLPEVVTGLLGARGRAIAPAAICGPCIAGELARKMPTCVVLTGANEARLDAIRSALQTDFYFLFPTTDVRGAETCAALKNAYAMGIAFAAGLHERSGGASGSIAMHNLESAIMAQSVFEMCEIVRVVDGDPNTALGLAGVGDLDVTTNGGRTGRFGKFLGLGLTPDKAIARMNGATLECLEILRVLETAKPYFQARGAAPLPLLDHMIEVALHDKRVDIPLSSFFGRGQ
jgi:glycerol-3-phosphate dehydrogenase (NAD(P)+)